MHKKIIISSVNTYLAHQSDPSNLKFVWAYEISILNKGNKIVQLLNRLWHITDLTGKIEEVQGPGVVGLQPLLKPDLVFTYTSFCQLMTPQGTMAGLYELQDLEGTHFTVEIPKFALCAPAEVTQPFRSRLH